MRPRYAGRQTTPQQSSAGISGAVGDGEGRGGPLSSIRSGHPDLRPITPSSLSGVGENTALIEPGRDQDSAGRLRNRPVDPPSKEAAWRS